MASDDWPTGPGACHSTPEGRRRAARHPRRDRPRSHRGEHPQAGLVRHPPHAVHPDRPGPRHRRGPRLDRGRDDEVRRGIRRTDDRRGAVLPPEPASRIPVDDPDQQRDRDAEGRRGRRPDLRRQRALRLAGRRRHGRHRRRTGRRRRRLGRRRLDGARAGDGQPPHRRDHQVRGGRGRGAGPLRLDLHGQPAQGRRRRRPGHVHQRHRRQQPRRRRQPRPPQRAAVRPGPAAQRGRRHPRAAAHLGGENDSPARDLARFVAEVAGPRRPAWTSA